MKVIELSNKVYLVRHWGKWYRVQRSAAQWQKLEPIIKNGKLIKEKEFTIEGAAESLAKRAGGKPVPPVDLTE